jgi:hypothetical protein
VSDEHSASVAVLFGDRSRTDRYVDRLSPAYDARSGPPTPTDVDLPWAADCAFEDPPTAFVMGWELPVRERLLADAVAPGATASPGVLAVVEGTPTTDPLDGGATDYLVAPADDETLHRSVHGVVLRARYRRQMAAIADLLEVEDLDADQRRRLQRLRTESDRVLAKLEDTVEYTTLFRTLLRD